MTIIKDFNSIGGAQIDYTGGEFFLRKDALELLEMSAACNMFSYFFTNATMLDKSKVQKIRGLNSIRMICVSLDDCIAECHDRFRGVPGAFKKTVAGIELLKEYNLPVCINLVINEYNHDRIGEIAKFFKTEYGLPSRVSPIFPIGRDKNLCGQEIDDICRAMNAWANTMSFANTMDSIKPLTQTASAVSHKAISPVCGIGKSMLFVQANGNVCLCPTLTENESIDFDFGNIKKTSISTIWTHSERFRKYWDLSCNKEDCLYKHVCKGGCRSRAFIYQNDVHAPDPISCQYIDQYIASVEQGNN